MCFLDWLYSLKTQHQPEQQASTTGKNTLRPLELTLMTCVCVCVRSVSFFFIKCTFILLKCFSPLLSDEAIPSSFGQCCQLLLLRFDDNSIIIKAPTHRCRRCHSAAQNCLVVIGQGAGEQMSTTGIAQSSKCFVYIFSCLTCIDDFLFKNIFQCLHLQKKRKEELMQ